MLLPSSDSSSEQPLRIVSKRTEPVQCVEARRAEGGQGSEIRSRGGIRVRSWRRWRALSVRTRRGLGGANGRDGEGAAFPLPNRASGAVQLKHSSSNSSGEHQKKERRERGRLFETSSLSNLGPWRAELYRTWATRAVAPEPEHDVAPRRTLRRSDDGGEEVAVLSSGEDPPAPARKSRTGRGDERAVRRSAEEEQSRVAEQ